MSGPFRLFGLTGLSALTTAAGTTTATGATGTAATATAIVVVGRRTACANRLNGRNRRALNPVEVRLSLLVELLSFYFIEVVASQVGIAVTGQDFDHALFDRFPKLKILVVESGGGWIGHYLDRMDALYERTPVGKGAKLKQKPSDYLRAGRFIMSADPDESDAALCD